MKIRLIAVGTKMPSWVIEGVNEYQKRLPNEFALDIIEIPLGHRGKGADLARAKRQEGELMLAAIPKGDQVIALEVGGRNWSTEQLAEQAEQWQMSGRNVSLLVGGPDGLAPECVALADQKWSLSGLTLPHPLVRILLAEQLYRAWSILQGHPYHK
ncbi:23S rRNA (pseudouridine(1915)-N(3))-methyltransferase RlmH [Amphritea sp. 2_MG-2023]|jgi:23S rRNA (pseudouridine1915-N3)-methyltransferase|uniref:23S rRNA (pseudouridine(1915)-N(3))-methyltransferase RlmH n=1 Tax=Amphritea TaxID=515417 RepID=UPI001C077E4F|nr:MULTISPECIES: 23S rRNA (pseudouridine(1915)-N(3))-methyltransferase RlmH [Amphritea]MBU2967566.1 23S rRNA (pseudouridine(1915)-N(3))-methyltransferase RlmH [Amphritea atlantica]MDO6419054.1 23S rRNA (pseudouridine(1915)-N(3))-methyltransferase RlmH [Amphritea sp. 2_MG-2023]MDX2421100.1 23S rRNA (pseudouridine(1915)-N(3))-methyltransferase RlmH [Amphritea sp.]